MIAGRATDLPAADHDVVMTGTRGLNAHFTQHQKYHIDKAVEGEVHILLRSDIRQHQVVHIGIDTAAPALPAVDPDAVLTAVVQIHLVLHHLVTSEDDTWCHLPHEKAVGQVEMTCHVFLHCQIKR